MAKRFAPMMMVNDGYHENLTLTKLDELLPWNWRPDADLPIAAAA